MIDYSKFTEVAACYDETKEALERARFEPLHRAMHYKKDLGTYRNAEILLFTLRDLQSTNLHDHDGEVTVLRCLKGKVVERIYIRDTNGDMLPFDTRQIKAGDIVALGPHLFHQITNLAKDGSVLLDFRFPVKTKELEQEGLLAAS